MTLSQFIIETVNQHPNGIKGVELAVHVAENKPTLGFSGIGELLATIEFLVACGDIIEMDYPHETIPNRVKSLYFPKGCIDEMVNPYNCMSSIHGPHGERDKDGFCVLCGTHLGEDNA